MKRQVVSKRDSKDLIAEVEASTGVHLELPRSAQVEILEPDDETRFVIIDGRFAFVALQGDKSYVPYVGSPDAVALFPSVSIDEGALKYIIKGADVMRPGISKYDEWGEAGKLVVVREDKKGRAAAVGRAAVASSEMAELKKGNCVKNLHHAGDKFWNAYRTI
ncbi:MAG TPA: PUA domain-containing protein [Nitrososphaerales archaeon]|nr:PUA domain-containing protein [Nitrososphaerales archaeon]